MTETPFTTRLAGDYVPATFEERGATVPFQKPELANARIRKNAQGELEVLVYGFSGGRGVYILPWRSVPEVLRLNLHDLTLHAEVFTTNAVTPERIQVALYRVARSGLAGEDMLESADDMLAERAQVSSATTLHILRRLLPDAGLPEPGLTVNGFRMTPALLGTSAGKAAARAALQAAANAGSLGMDADTAFERVQKMASLMLPLGTDARENPGQLRSLLASIRAFATRPGADSGEGAALVAEVARLTVAIGDDLIREIDREIAEPGAFLKDWDARSQRLKQSVERLWWLLDGWKPVCDLWSEWSGASCDPLLMLTTLRILPLVPRNECGRFHDDCASLYRRQSSVFGKMQEQA
jgi:hypothetical protein